MGEVKSILCASRYKDASICVIGEGFVDVDVHSVITEFGIRKFLYLLPGNIKSERNIPAVDVYVIMAEFSDTLTDQFSKVISTVALGYGSQLVVCCSNQSLHHSINMLGKINCQIVPEPTTSTLHQAVERALSLRPSANGRQETGDDTGTISELISKLSEITHKLGGNELREGEDQNLDDLAFPELSQQVSSRKPIPLPPNTRLIRGIIKQRRERERFFGSDLFADPAWDILLDLMAARLEGRTVSVTSLCIASAVPATTALRWISQMIDLGLCERIEDSMDRRRAFINLSDKAANALVLYFRQAEQIASRIV